MRMLRERGLHRILRRQNYPDHCFRRGIRRGRQRRKSFLLMSAKGPQYFDKPKAENERELSTTGGELFDSRPSICRNIAGSYPDTTLPLFVELLQTTCNSLLPALARWSVSHSVPNSPYPLPPGFPVLIGAVRLVELLELLIYAGAAGTAGIAEKVFRL